MKPVMSDGALRRLRVIDLSQLRAGPTCVKQFADFGADVIKVEPPPRVQRGELYVGARDGADMQNLHRNKRSSRTAKCRQRTCWASKAVGSRC